MTHPLRLYRETHGLTLDELALRAKTSTANVSRVETGHQWPGPDLMQALIKASKNEVTAEDMLKGYLLQRRKQQKQAEAA